MVKKVTQFVIKIDLSLCKGYEDVIKNINLVENQILEGCSLGNGLMYGVYDHIKLIGTYKIED